MGVVVHDFNSSTQEAETEAEDLCELEASLIYRDHTGLYSKTLSKNGVLGFYSCEETP